MCVKWLTVILAIGMIISSSPECHCPGLSVLHCRCYNTVFLEPVERGHKTCGEKIAKVKNSSL